jgi:hypothetical protein
MGHRRNQIMPSIRTIYSKDAKKAYLSPNNPMGFFHRGLSAVNRVGSRGRCLRSLTVQLHSIFRITQRRPIEAQHTVFSKRTARIPEGAVQQIILREIIAVEMAIGLQLLLRLSQKREAATAVHCVSVQLGQRQAGGLHFFPQHYYNLT